MQPCGANIPLYKRHAPEDTKDIFMMDEHSESRQRTSHQTSVSNFKDITERQI